MNVKDFQTQTLDQLAKLTGIDAPRWSRYFNGAYYNEKTLQIAAAGLEMDIVTLVHAIQLRRLDRELQLELRNKTL